MADKPTLYIVASDANRNGKTLLARLVVDYLLLDGKDPFAIDTDAPEGPLRSYFPGRTLLADFDKTQGQMKVFDTIMASPGRHYIIDLPQRHMHPFFLAASELGFFQAVHDLGFRVVVFYIVDRATGSLRAAREIYDAPGLDLFVAVKNDHVGSSWPPKEGALVMPVLPRSLVTAVSDRRFSFRNFVLGDDQGLQGSEKLILNSFLADVLGSLNSLDVELSLTRLRG